MGRKAMIKPKPANSYQQYLLGNSWHCTDAVINPAIPLQVSHNTGAHHWLEFKAGKPREFYCRYCFEIRKFKPSWKWRNNQFSQDWNQS